MIIAIKRTKTLRIRANRSLVEQLFYSYTATMSIRLNVIIPRNQRELPGVKMSVLTTMLCNFISCIIFLC